MTDSDRAAAPSREGAVARLRSVGAAGRRRLAALVESSLRQVFDAPLDVRNADEALRAVSPDEQQVAAAAVRRAAEWGVARTAGRLATRYGSLAAGRVVVPLTVALEFGFTARDGVRELQVLASLLVNRLRLEGLPADPELVRRTVLALYLEPGRRPDLRVPLHRRSLGVARRLTAETLPRTSRRQSMAVRQRVRAVADLPLAPLVDEWTRITLAGEAGTRAPATGRRVIDVEPSPPPGGRPSGAAG